MRLEIEVPDPPAGWQYTGEYRQPAMNEPYEVDGEAVISEGECGQYLILRRREPVRESRWGVAGTAFGYSDRSEAVDALSKRLPYLVRIDYEDGHPFSATIEPVEPQ